MDKMASTKQLYYVCLLDLYMDEFAVFLHEGETIFICNHSTFFLYRKSKGELHVLTINFQIASSELFGV